MELHFGQIGISKHLDGLSCLVVALVASLDRSAACIVRESQLASHRLEINICRKI